METNESAPYTVRLALIIRERVYNAYARTTSMRWIHKSKAKYLVARLGVECLAIFSALGVPTHHAMEVSDCLATNGSQESAT